MKGRLTEEISMLAWGAGKIKKIENASEVTMYNDIGAVLTDDGVVYYYDFPDNAIMPLGSIKKYKLEDKNARIRACRLGVVIFNSDGSVQWCRGYGFADGIMSGKMRGGIPLENYF